MALTLSVVHVFCSSHRFGSYEALRAYVHPTYTEGGDQVPSRFMTEVGLELFEPACIEVEAVASPVPLRQLLEGASYGDRWIPMLNDSILANEAICVFEPNQIAHPSAATSVTYCGTFELSTPGGASFAELPLAPAAERQYRLGGQGVFVTESSMPPFMTSAEAFDVKDLLAPWRWLVPSSATPLFVSVFGDWVFGAPDGSLWALSVLEGTYAKVASSASEYNQLKSSFDWLNKTFMAAWQEIAHRHGLVPTVHECIGWKVHPALGGAFAKENLKVFSMRVYQYLMGQLHQQLQQGRRP